MSLGFEEAEGLCRFGRVFCCLGGGRGVFDGVFDLNEDEEEVGLVLVVLLDLRPLCAGLDILEDFMGAMLGEELLLQWTECECR